MIEARGNLWTYEAEARVITTNGTVKRNGQCVMGRGCAREAAVTWPELPAFLGSLIRIHGNIVFYIAQFGAQPLFSFPVKHNWMEEADPELIVRSAKQLVQQATHHTFTKIVLPRPGCGNGKLSWQDVKPLIAPILDDRFTVITF